MEFIMYTVSARLFYKNYPWREHAMLLVPLVLITCVIIFRYGMWGTTVADSFKGLRESSPAVTVFMHGISDWGNIFLDSLYIGILFRSWRSQNSHGKIFSLSYAVAAVLSLCIVLQLIKYGLGMPRPGVPWPPHPWESHSYTSFPSGHTAHTITAAFPLVFWYRSRLLCFALSLLIGFMGLSRVWLGEHHPVDLLGSIVFGSLVVMYLYYFLLCADVGRWQRSSDHKESVGKEQK